VVVNWDRRGLGWIFGRRFSPRDGDTLEQVAPSLEAFKARLDVALGSLVWWLATLHPAGGLKLDDHCGPFQPRPFHSVKYIKQCNC